MPIEQRTITLDTITYTDTQTVSGSSTPIDLGDCEVQLVKETTECSFDSKQAEIDALLADGYTLKVDEECRRVYEKLDPPPPDNIAIDDSAEVNEGESVTINVIANDVSGTSEPLSIYSFTQPSNGFVTQLNSNSFRYTNTNLVSTDTFTYIASNDNGQTNTATVTITIIEVNEPPVANDDNYSTSQNQILNVPSPGILSNDSDPDGNLLTAVLESNVSNGTLNLGYNGSFIYTPDTDFFGTDSFTYRANDGENDSNVATVSITVNEIVVPNEPPVAVDDSYSTDQETQLSVSAPGIISNDSDPEDDSLTATLVSDVSNGTLSLSSNGSFTYLPDVGFSGTDSFTYKVNDGEDDSNTATVTVEVISTQPEIQETTNIFIFFDDSGSMESTLAPLQDMRDNPSRLKGALLPYYNNDETLYNNKVRIVQDSSERTWSFLDIWESSNGQVSDETIVLVFQDEASDYANDPSRDVSWSPNDPRTPEHDNDIQDIRAKIANTEFKQVVFQIATDPFSDTAPPESFRAFKPYLQAVQNGQGNYSGTNGLVGKEDVVFKYDIIPGDTSQNYTNLVVETLQEMGYSI